LKIRQHDPKAFLLQKSANFILIFLAHRLILDINIDAFIGMTKVHSRIRSFLSVFSTIILAALLTFFGCHMIEDRLDNYLNAAHKLWGFSGSVMVAWNGVVSA
jgi:hypothetical protein